MSVNETALSYWFPRIKDAGLPVPKTILLDMSQDAIDATWAAMDGESKGDAKPFFAAIAEAGKELGFPCFLRTDFTSNKHQWKDTCYLSSPFDIPRHVMELVEFSCCCDFIGLPWEKWAVREFLPTIPFGICPRYGNMPVCREFRFFVDGDKVICHHPYWPLDSLKEGGCKNIDYQSLCGTPDLPLLFSLAERAGQAVCGFWSVDILETKRGWYVTDMAEGEKSFHWEGCANGAGGPQSRGE